MATVYRATVVSNPFLSRQALWISCYIRTNLDLVSIHLSEYCIYARTKHWRNEVLLIFQIARFEGSVSGRLDWCMRENGWACFILPFTTAERSGIDEVFLIIIVICILPIMIQAFYNRRQPHFNLMFPVSQDKHPINHSFASLSLPPQRPFPRDVSSPNKSYSYSHNKLYTYCSLVHSSSPYI